MQVIHKVAAVVIEEGTFLVVRKKGTDIWTSLGGKPEAGESEEETLLREIREEMGCAATMYEKLGDFEAPAAHDDAIVRLSTYRAALKRPIVFEDPELEEYRFIGADYREQGVTLSASLAQHVIPACIERGLLSWPNA